MKGLKKRMVSVLLVSALVLTGVPNIAELTVYAAETTWKVLSEKDIVFDDIYDLEDNVLIGRKSGKIATLDDKLKQIAQSKYDQIETRAKDGYLVSKKNGNETEYAVLSTTTGKITPFITGDYDGIEPFYCGNGKYYYKVKKGMKYGLLNWETGAKEIPVDYTKIMRLYDDSETGTIFAEKEDGTNGFICNGKKFGFDKSILNNEGCLYGTSVVIESDIYYVKEYFEDEDVFDDLYHIESSTNLSYLKKTIENHLADDKCKLVFYDKDGITQSADSILNKIESATSENDSVITTIKEKAKNDALQYCSKKYSVQEIKIKNTSVQQYGSVYVVCVVAGWTDDEEEEYSKNLIGVYGESGESLQFGLSLIRYDIDDVDDEGWDEDVLVRNDKNEIYYCNDSGTVRLIYTDSEGVFANVSKKTSAYDGSIVIYGQKNCVMIANSQNGYVKIGCKVFGDSYGGIDSDVFSRGLLVNDAEERKLILYDYDYNEVKVIDLSDMGEQLQTTEGEYVITVNDSNNLLIVDTEAKMKKISLMEYPDFSDVRHFYKMLDEMYAYIEDNGRHVLYRISDQAKLMEKNDASMWIESCYRIDGVNVMIYSINIDEDTTYYGLMDVNGNIIADAKLLKYTTYSATSSSHEDTKQGIWDYIEFKDEEGKWVYYYGEDMSAHEKAKDEEDDDSEDDGISYGNVKYYCNYLQDGGREEKVCDSKGTVLTSYKKTEEELEKDGYRHNVYMFPDCQSILLVKKHWDGKRGSGATDEVPTQTPVPANDSVQTSFAGSDNKSHTESAKASKKESKVKLVKSQIIRIKNVKGKKIKLKIKKVKKATGYQIFYSFDSRFKKKKVLTSKSTSVTLKKLKKKVYYIKIRAYIKKGKKKTYGPWSKKRKIRVKK